MQINGVPIGDARTGIGYKQLSDEVCKGYTGPLEVRRECVVSKVLYLKRRVHILKRSGCVHCLRHDDSQKRPSACQPKRLRVDEPKTEAATEPVIKPCPPKKKSKDSASQAPPLVAGADEDAPGIGARIDRELPQTDIDALAAANKNGRVLDPEAEPGSESGSAIQTLAAPAFVLVVIGVVAFRFFSTDHKKDA